ncbi:GPN-loop GTPase 3, partial [Selaginella moellendorffii]
MEEFNYGPNGGLIYCIYLEENMDDWLAEKLEDYIDDDVVFDCPGQIELYTHIPVFKSLVEQLKRWDFNLCAVYLLDSQFVSDVTKYISGCLSSLSAMVQLELPHVNVLTKMDLVAKKRDIEDYLDPDPVFLLSEMNANTAPRYGKLNAALAELIDDYRMVNFVTSGRHKRSQYLLST